MKTIFPDKNVSSSFYKNLNHNELLVTSIFYTIQGEGIFAGTPSVFLRLAGCNYGGKGVTGPGCPFCDTDFRVANGKVMRFSQVIDAIRSCSELERPLVVVTGGEPTLQDNLGKFLDCAPPDMHFQVESNGSRCINMPRSNTTLVVSPKVLEGADIKNPSYAKALPRDVFERADCLKFVYSSDPSSPYNTLPDYVAEFYDTGRRVYISPMAVYHCAPLTNASIWNKKEIDIVATRTNYQAAAELVMETGYWLSLQTHLFLDLP